MNISVINKSIRLSNDDVETMTAAVQVQLDLHVAPIWDRLPATIQFYKDPNAVPAGSQVITFFDSPDQPGVLGWHSEDGGGEPYAKVFVSPVLDNGGGILDGGSANVSVASVLSHEACEMFVDPSINLWADGPMVQDGNRYSYEVCDPVESGMYPVTMLNGVKVFVSNFVTPRWFDLLSPGEAQMDYMNQVNEPFKLASGGYCVVRNDQGEEQQIFAEVAPPKWKMELKKVYGRLQRRK